jgi:tetratricopeptide (TPR) repeat protein
MSCHSSFRQLTQQHNSIVYYDQQYAKDPNRWIGDLYGLLNRTDVFADFTTTSTVGVLWAGKADDNCLGVWNFLRQIIVGRELAIRLKHLDGGMSYTGFTERILGSLIVSELWLKHVRIILTDAKLPAGGVKGAETAEQKAKAEDCKNQGNEALKKNEYQKAVDLYTEAIKLDLSNAIYRCNRSAALIGLEMYEDAEEDAYVATLLDSKYAKAWSRLGMAMFKQGDVKRAEKAYERAIQVAGKDATAQMRQGLASAEEKIKEKVKAINSEEDIAKQHSLHSAYFDEDWEISGKTPEFHSLIHEQQIEGLLLFAERMRWPYINEVRDYAEDVYGSVRAGGMIGIDLHDWLYGIVLPGKWFAFKIMTALILCTPGIRDKAGIAPYFDCGLVLPTRSYWRLRTVLGRVLGCLPGIISLCGWIGPCPKVEFDPPVERPVQPRHIRVKARRIALTEHNPNSDDGVWRITSHDHRNATRIRPDEEIEPYLAEMRNPSSWVIPEPPVRDVGTCEIVSIQLKKLAQQVEVAQKAAQGKIQDAEAEREAEYRASITFKMDNNEEAITFKLFTNPVFVTPPSCLAGPKGQHEVHMRELPRYQKNIWSVERLKDHTAEDSDDDEVMIINATGKGAEVLARAWCSERGKCAVIRRPGGPCFVCAVRAASKPSLATCVLIWTG